MTEFLFTRRQLVCLAATLPVAPVLLAAPTMLAATRAELSVLDPAGPLDDWTERNQSKAVSWLSVGSGSEAAVEVRSESAFAVLTRDVNVTIDDQSRLTWSWRVDEMPADADLKSLESDDLGAGVALIFGKPGLLRKVPPMLIYTWSGSANAGDAIVTCRRHPDAMRFVIVRSGLESTPVWRTESRNVARDYEAAFGEPPSNEIHAVALWSDSDQTGASTRAAFGPITLHNGLTRV